MNLGSPSSPAFKETNTREGDGFGSGGLLLGGQSFISLEAGDSGGDQRHLKGLCVHFPSLGSGLDLQRHFQTEGLPRAVTLRACSFWRASQGAGWAAVGMDRGLDVSSASPAAMRRNRREPPLWSEIALPSC